MSRREDGPVLMQEQAKTEMRKRIGRIMCKTRADFNSSVSYEDYLEEKERHIRWMQLARKTRENDM